MTPTEYRDISVLDVWEGVVRQKWWILGAMFALSAVLFGTSLFLTPVYRAQTVLVAAAEEQPMGLAALAGQLGGVAQLAGFSPTQKPRTQEAMAVLKSRGFIEGFIRDEGLLPVLFADRWNSEAQRWLEGADEPTLWQGYVLFTESIQRVAQDFNSGLITLTIDWEDGELAALWANSLISRLNARMRQRAIAEAEASMEYLTSELSQTSLVEVKDSIYGLIEVQVKTRMVANVRPEFVFRVVDPAIAPDPSAFVRPKRLIWLLSGLLGGLMLGCVIAFRREALRGSPAP